MYRWCQRVNILLKQVCPLSAEMVVVSWIRAHQTSGAQGIKKRKKIVWGL